MIYTKKKKVTAYSVCLVTPASLGTVDFLFFVQRELIALEKDLYCFSPDASSLVFQ